VRARVWCPRLLTMDGRRSRETAMRTRRKRGERELPCEAET
jgi:hypothetical protein